MKGYKGFEKGMICRGKQYAENSVRGRIRRDLQEWNAPCKNPLDVMDYYPLVDENGNTDEFVEVENDND